jgi:hypothetical protein
MNNLDITNIKNYLMENDDVLTLNFDILYDTFKNDIHIFIVNKIINDKERFFLIIEKKNDYKYKIKKCDNKINKFFELSLKKKDNILTLPENVYKISFKKTQKGFYFSKNNMILKVCYSKYNFEMEIPKLKKILLNY